MNEVGDASRWFRISSRLPYLSSLTIYAQPPLRSNIRYESVLKKDTFDVAPLLENKLNRLILVDWDVKSRISIAAVRHLTSLTHLSYQGSSEGVGEAVVHLRELRELNLCRCPIRDSVTCFKSVARMDNLTCLTLSSVEYVDCFALQELGASTSIVELVLSGVGTWTNDRCVTCPPHIVSLKKLTFADVVLDPTNNESDQIVWGDLCSILPSLCCLQLYNVQLPEPGVQLIEQLVQGAYQRIRTLVLFVDLEDGNGIEFGRSLCEHLRGDAKVYVPGIDGDKGGVPNFFHRKIMDALKIPKELEEQLWNHDPYQREASPLPQELLRWDERWRWTREELFGIRSGIGLQKSCSDVRGDLPHQLLK